MSQLYLKDIQLGKNADVAKNFRIVVPTPEDGTLTIERGDGTDVLVVQANGLIVAPKMNRTSETKAATGTSVSFSVPAWATKLTLLWDAVSTTGANNTSTRIGKDTAENTNYASNSFNATSTVQNPISSTNGFNLSSANAANFLSGAQRLYLVGPSTNRWTCESQIAGTGGTADFQMVQTGVKAAAAPINLIQITTVNQVDTFDNGNFTLICEG